MILEKEMRDILLRLNSKLKNSTGYDMEKQRSYIDSFKEPNDDFERSYFQYKCQMYLLSRLGVFIYSLASFVMWYIYCGKRYELKVSASKCDAVFIDNGIGVKILPNSVKEEFKHIEVIDVMSRGVVDAKVLSFTNKLRSKAILSPYFYLKCLVKISLYNKIVKMYNPRAIITYSETSFCSSILTEFLNRENIEHINVMHGEKFFFIRDAFVRFDRFYVWDEHYRDLFIELRACFKQFYIEKPEFLSIDFDRFRHQNKLCCITYYLQDETEESIKIIKDSLEQVSNRYTFKMRPHPRMLHKSVLNLVPISYIQNPYSVSLEESIANSDYLISRNSTVLYQGFIFGKKIVIDDISNVKEYDYLMKAKYIMLNKPHILLSDFITKSKDGECYGILSK